MECMLKIEDLKVSYGNIRALKGISLHINAGEVVALIGANGAGKTTLMRTIMGLIKPESGSIQFMGREIAGTETKKIVQSGLALSPEGRKIFPELSTRDNLALGGYFLKDSEVQEEIEKQYEIFPVLREREKQMAGTMSGGEQQMLAVARALMSRPKMLLLDEPSLGLAPLLVSEIFSLVDKIRAAGTTVLLVEQNARMALKNSDRGYVLETGNIALEGSSSELLGSEIVREAYLGGL